MDELSDHETCKAILQEEVKRWITKQNKQNEIKNDATAIEKTQLKTILNKKKELKNHTSIISTITNNTQVK